MNAIELLRSATVRLRELPGGVLLNEVVRRAFSSRHRCTEIRDFDGDLRIRLDLGEHMQSQIFWNGSYSRNILHLLDRLLKPGMTVIDAGANIGEISLFAAKRVRPRGQVYAFEPLSKFADQLRWNVEANGMANVHVQRQALLDAPGSLQIYVADELFRDGTRHDGLGTLFPSDARPKAEQAVEVTTLDAFVRQAKLGKIDLLKLDIEGSELPALKGGSEVIRECEPLIIVEVGRETCRAAGYEPEDIVDFLRLCGYSLHRIGRRGALRPLTEVGLSRFQNLLCLRDGVQIT